MKQVSVDAFKEVVRAESGNPSVDFINVCTPAEYAEKHIEGVRNVPLSEIATRAGEFKDKRTVYVHCRSGNRARQAIETLQRLGVSAELVNVEGGLMAWDQAGFATRLTTKRMPIMRQVFIVAGALVLSGIVLGTLVNPAYYALSAFVGAGLMFSGISGICTMTYVLARMPWNRA